MTTDPTLQKEQTKVSDINFKENPIPSSTSMNGHNMKATSTTIQEQSMTPEQLLMAQKDQAFDLLYSAQLNSTDETIKTAALTAYRIRHLLLIFPKLSHSMLQIGLGTAHQSKHWRPVLDEMIAEGIIAIDNYNSVTPTGRQQTYSVISLTE